MEKRRHQRMAVKNLWADVSDGKGFFSGLVTDLSRFGLRMVDLPGKLDNNSQRLSLVVSGHGQNFKMLVRPRWSRKEVNQKCVGVEIINAPWGWTEFVMDFEPAPLDTSAEMNI